MNRAIFATVALLLGGMSSAWAYRVVELTEDAYELVLGDVTLPARVQGSVRFKTCPTCPTTSLRVTRATIYIVNGAPLVLADFLAAAAAIRQMDDGEENTDVYVFVDVKSRQVNRLRLTHFNR